MDKVQCLISTTISSFLGDKTSVLSFLKDIWVFDNKIQSQTAQSDNKRASLSIEIQKGTIYHG